MGQQLIIGMQEKQKAIFDLGELRQLINQFKEENQNPQVKICLEEIPSDKDSMYLYLVNQLQRKNMQKQQIVNQSIRVFQAFLTEELVVRNQIRQFQMNIEEKQTLLDDLKNQHKSLQKENKSLHQTSERLHQEIIFLNETIRSLEEVYKGERKELKSQINEERNLRQMDFINLQSLSEQNKNLKEYIELSEDEKKELMKRVEKLEEQREVLEKKIQILSDQLEWKQKKREEWEQKVKEKEEIIENLQSQLEALENVFHSPFQQLERSVELQNGICQSFQNLTEEPKPVKEKLNVQLSQSQLFTSEKNLILKHLELKRTNSSFMEELQPVKQTNINKNSVNSGKGKRNLPDPYYCHFLLLAQGIKIRENRDEFYGMNVKPLYKEIVEKRVPMHEWEFWLKKRFVEIQEEKEKIS